MTPTSPGEIRSSNRKRAIRRTHGTKAWRNARLDFLADHPLCQEHEKVGTKELATTPHHPYMESVKGEYLDLTNCIPLCSRCHFALHKGMNLCPNCKVHYKRWDQGTCRVCFDKAHPEIVKARAENKKKWQEILKERMRKARLRAKAKRRIYLAKSQGSVSSGE